MVASEGWSAGVLTVEEELGRGPALDGAPSMEVGYRLFTSWAADSLVLTAFVPARGS